MPELETFSDDQIRSFDPHELQFRLTTLNQRKAVYKHEPNLRLLDDYMEKVRSEDFPDVRSSRTISTSAASLRFFPTQSSPIRFPIFSRSLVRVPIFSDIAKLSYSCSDFFRYRKVDRFCLPTFFR